MTEAAKLEPCPFCGGEAVHGLGGQFDGSGVFPIAFCKACGAKTKQARDKKQAIDLWNRRHSSDPDAVRALGLIASFPIDEQNQLKRDSDLIYGFNDWKLTVGDVRRARAAQRQLPAATDDVADTLLKVCEELGCQATAVEPIERAKHLRSELEQAKGHVEKLVNSKALAGIRSLVAGWNGEGREGGPFQHRHPDRLGARIDTNCGAIYALDKALEEARRSLSVASTERRDD